MIAATNRDLEADVRTGAFRRDLFFRLNVFPLHLAPLRERPEDIPALALHVLNRPGRAPRSGAPTLSEGDVRRLVAYDWPGNVRELENVIERAVILARNGRLRIDVPTDRGPSRRDRAALSSDGGVLAEDERRARDRASIVEALVLSGGKVSGAGGAAERLGVRPTTLASRMRKASIDRQSFRS